MPQGKPPRVQDHDRADRLSRFAALILRHKPETVGITLDTAGFVELDVLARAVAAQPGWGWVDEAELRALAARDPRRYEIAGTRIRARYGHSVAIEIPGTPVVPPEWLYHGTIPQALTQIRQEGLKHQDRQFVHLSTTRQDALAVGRRHSPEAVVVTVLARQAHEAGVTFYQAAPSLYLAREVPPEHLRFT